MELPKSIKLYYFDIPGKGEAIRLVCTYGNIPFDDVRLNRDQFLEMKSQGKLLFGQLPLLQVNEHDYLFQSASILRYVGKLSNLYPKDDEIYAAKIDAIMDQENDMFTGLSVSKYKERFGYAHLTEEDIQKVRNSLNNEILPRHLTFFENLLKQSKTGWIAGGTTPSIADFALVPRLQWLTEPGLHTGIDSNILESFPLLYELIQRFLNLPAIETYYKK